MENKDKKRPNSKAAKGRLIQTKFPKDRPILWGPNQDTVFPDTYNEPSDWHEKELLRIPQVVRFIYGGQPISPPPPPPGSGFMALTDFTKEEIVSGIQSPSQNIQLVVQSFHLLILPSLLNLSNMLFWRSIEYLQEQETEISGLGPVTFDKILASGSLTEDGIFQGTGVTYEDGNVLIQVSGDIPIQSGADNSGKYSRARVFTTQFSSDGIFWTTEPLNFIYPPVP